MPNDYGVFTLDDLQQLRGVWEQYRFNMAFTFTPDDSTRYQFVFNSSVNPLGALALEHTGRTFVSVIGHGSAFFDMNEDAEYISRKLDVDELCGQMLCKIFRELQK